MYYEDGTGRYEYNIRDHLGNTRLTFTDKDGDGTIEISDDAEVSEVLQENHYYPFGMALGGQWMANAGREDKYQYNGKEFNEDFGLNWYDYGARWYMPDIGRWNAVDPLAEEYYAWSPFHYGYNNPINVIDPDGRFNEYVIDNTTGKTEQISDLGGDEFDIVHHGDIRGDGSITIDPSQTEVLEVQTVVSETSEMSFRLPGLNRVGTGNPGATNLDGTDDPIFNLLTLGGARGIGVAEDFTTLGFSKLASRSRVPQDEWWIKLRELLVKSTKKGRKGQGPGTFFKEGEEYLKFVKESPKTDFSKTRTSRGKPFEPPIPDTRSKSKWKYVIDLFFGNFDNPNF